MATAQHYIAFVGAMDVLADRAVELGVEFELGACLDGEGEGLRQLIAVQVLGVPNKLLPKPEPDLVALRHRVGKVDLVSPHENLCKIVGQFFQ